MRLRPVLAALAALVITNNVLALDLTQQATFNIPPQRLASALTQFSQQAGIQVVVGKEVGDRMTAGIQGTRTVGEALRELLKDSSLTFTAFGETAIAIGEPTASRSEPVLRLAQAPSERDRQSGPSTSDTSQQDKSKVAENIAEVIVTGTSIRGVAPVGSPLVQVDQQEIQDRGVVSTGNLLATIPQFDGFATRPVPISGGAGPTTSPSLRTLGPGATLSLLNSHRLVGIGTLSTVADPTSLPIAAISRVEVVADGASATYGSDAVGGVLNVILRKDLDGVDARASFGTADGYHQQLYSLVGGKTWDTGFILAGVQYQENNGLLGARRDYITNDFRSVGGTDNRTRSTDLPNVTVGGVTYGYSGTGFNNTPNLATIALGSDLIPAQSKWSAVLNWEQRLGDNLRLFGDGHYGDIHTVFRTSASSDTLAFDLPSTNPFFRSPVPGQTSVAVQQSAAQLIGRFHEDVSDLEYWGASAGAEMDFSPKWSGRLVANFGRSDTVVDQDVFDNAAFAAAVASTDPATAYDPFTGRTSAATRARIVDAISNPGSTQELSQVTAAIDGSLFALPGGDAKLALGSEYRHESYEGFGVNGKRSAPVTNITDSKRNVWSAYGELFLPLVGAENNIPLLRQLEFNAALRYDDYSDFGNTTNPKFGVNWEVVEGFTLRGTHGKAFHAPSLADLKAIDDIAIFFAQANAPGLLTPVPTLAPMNVILLAGGNPDLKPEKATTWSVGADFKPTFAPQLRMSATYFDIDYTDRVVVPVGLAFSSPAMLNRLVTFNPTEAQIDAAIAGLGPQGAPRFAPGATGLIVDYRRLNLGGVRIKGLDYGASYDFDLGMSKLVAGIDGTHLFDKTSTTVPGSAATDDLRTTPTPEWRFRTHLGWKLNDLRANVFWNHVGRYYNTTVAPVQHVKSYNPVDVNFAIKIPLDRFGMNPEIQFDVQNVFDEDPPTLYSGNGAFNPASQGYGNPASPLGRLFQVSLKTEF
jgi:iron complex outermembrane receptor protein